MDIKKARKIYETLAAAVAYIEVITPAGDVSIGSAFHVGEGVFVTARHVVENNKISEIATTEDAIVPSDDIAGAYLTTHHAGKGKIIGGPYFYPNDDIDVAALVMKGIDAPTVELGGHLDYWLGTELVLCQVIVMGYPPIPFSDRSVLVATVAEVNCIIDKYTGGHPHFILSAMARGGFSGGIVITDFGMVLGVIVESLTDNNKPTELGYLSMLSVEPIYVCLEHHGVMPKEMHNLWHIEHNMWFTKNNNY
jgi:hypothetical protein